ncbi:osmoprotectant transport system permease protein [Kushneria sinocarnis]|uniref:Osmoprotectant transport system permease protein n=1 Tax=Kushneria sinocarnis TaxID=595502 RepID=A0A420WXI6_9GAMM|nr:ABC transporter permease [Kushneria sinocarnis]RKR04382.1 osmoprotectant transport system permease protein [Kushneria sinocarnis]
MNDSLPALLQGLIGWLADPAHWQGSNGVLERGLEHIFYMMVSTLIGAAIALPIGIGLGHSGRGGLLAINLTNIGRAVPSFGVIIFVFLLVGYGVIPVIVALVALAIPPMVTNSFVGMRGVDPAIRQAATAVGMTPWQRLLQVELPIAMPLIMAGVRTSAVQVMSTATLAAYVGLGGLGRYLIDGLAVRDLVQVLVGAVLVAILAVATELLFAGLQRLVTARGLRHD